MDETGLERLKTLKYMLDNHDTIFPYMGFDMEWWYNDDRDQYNWCENDSFVDTPKCGSVACALGSAALYPSLQKQGLRVRHCGQEDYMEIYYHDGHNVYFDNIDGAKKFFKINIEEAENLFLPESYDMYEKDIKSSDVSKKVQKVIENYEAVS